MAKFGNSLAKLKKKMYTKATFRKTHKWIFSKKCPLNVGRGFYPVTLLVPLKILIFFATLVSEICCTLSMYSLCYNLQPQKMETILRLLFLIWKKNLFLGISISWYGGKGVTKKCPKDISTFLAKKDNLCLALWKRLLFTPFY